MASVAQRWNRYIRNVQPEFDRQIAYDIVCHSIQSARYPENVTPLSLKVNPNEDTTPIISTVFTHCNALGLKCDVIGISHVRFKSGSCLNYQDIRFDVTGYPADLHIQWSKI